MLRLAGMPAIARRSHCHPEEEAPMQNGRILAALTAALIALPGAACAAGSLDKASCTFNGKKLYGKIQIVSAFPDVKVQEVSAFPDLKVQKVSAFPDACGKWQRVNAFPDTKVEIVNAFPDVKIEYVTAFPGVQ